jgi:hypothetical protein
MADDDKCGGCGGTGETFVMEDLNGPTHWETCKFCNGTGKK